MKRIFNDSNFLDENAKKKGLDTIILMENAGANLAKIIKKACKKRNIKRAKILFLLGGGNNASDGLVAMRHLKRVSAFKLNFMENENFKKQESILKNYNFKFLEKEPNFKKYEVIVDCILGTGVKRELDEKTCEILNKVNESKALKIACDIPTALGQKICFKANITACMGALKEILLEDFAKEFVGKIKQVRLGISNKKFIPNADSFLLQKKDLTLIKRKINANKGNFGHIFIAANASAGSLSALAALNFGASLVSLLAKKSFSPLIMLKEKLSKEAKVVAIGMGLEDLSILKNPLLDNLALVLDANCFLSKDILPHLKRENVVLTPHPKEFSRLLKLCFNEDISVDEIQKNRFFYARKFSLAYPCVLVLKGANPIICQKEQIFVVNLGMAGLAKGGSGDCLSGMIASNLATNFTPLNAASNAVLAHALVSKKYKFNQNSFDALKLIKGLKCL
ncbi:MULTISPECIES: NAD(P)H-hydrate dehydratase [unclassified Campylobacter]|uniref:NAD(P)H-hydrate dehydratase n=1 Tax=unclassified Campylobacter TaxID=2593542 RepID=UPI001237EE69|nr:MULTISPECIES: NAD(P)H-hydrate dehydratase [unclassified Campylobacter]KAA6225130.1 NAD(P)H-hydrate dehydratase [Campylobacter sp. LR196d]KAA6226144.1 NAD(P)H-hydrate dehydratase [Campylobacter sp. LR185c]KAA6228092.1 NAD(P)H-hydrate dehydratase [Campylobacter sp. LR286c]KAA6231344.1 NAD(P)H-hydrate dehydratase [Campylobacter sp. LR264d]KAA6231556.1 NAD(P)H-hydrate dehydratase [Campylobacter sp. LR291e]